MSKSNSAQSLPFVGIAWSAQGPPLLSFSQLDGLDFVDEVALYTLEQYSWLD